MASLFMIVVRIVMDDAVPNTEAPRDSAIPYFIFGKPACMPMFSTKSGIAKMRGLD